MEGLRKFLMYLGLAELFSFGISAVMGFYYLTMGVMSLGDVIYITGVAFLYLSMFSPTLALRMMKRKKVGKVTPAIPMAAVCVFFAALMIFTFLAPYVLIDEYSVEYTLYNARLPEDYLEINEDLEGLYLLGGNVCIRGNVTARNVTLVFSEGSRLWVEKGSTLLLENATIDLHRTQFEVYGKVIARNVTFIEPWGDPAHLNGDGGVEIYGYVEMYDVVVRNGTTNGLFFYRSSGVLKNVTVIGCNDDGIELYMSDVYAEGLLITDTEWSIVSIQSNLTLVNSRVTNNTYGIALDRSHLVLVNSTVTNNAEWDLMAFNNSTVETSSSTVGVEGAPEVDSEAQLCLSLCVMGFIISFIFALATTRWTAMALSRDDEEEGEKLFNSG